MIKLKELTNRVYEGKDCIRFEYQVVQKEKKLDDESRECFTALYRRSRKDPKAWRMRVILPRDRDCDSQVYTFDYILPKENVDLALITAIGLKYFQLKMKEEVQKKSNWDFLLGEIVKDM